MPRSIHALVPVLLLLASSVNAEEPARVAAEAPPPHAVGGGTLLTDGTTEAHWMLPNGLRVVTRHVPGVRSAAVTLAYRLGTREDPVSREGLAELVGQVAFTGRAGDVPSRTIGELDQLRPGGWSLKVGPHVTEMTEACPTALLPGVLHQVCQRLHGVAVNDTLVRAARTEVRRRLMQNYNLQADRTLYFLSGEMAAGRPAERAMRYATGEALNNIPAKDVGAMVADRLVPVNTVLSVVGDLQGLELRTMLGRELGTVAGGKPAPPLVWNKTQPSAASLARLDIKKPMGIVAILAPALTDTMHAYFTAFAISAASTLASSWGRPDPPLSSRFNYSIATDPGLIRFYPPTGSAATLAPDRQLSGILDKEGEAIADSASIRQAAESMLWLTGGPIPQDLVKRARTDPTVVHTLATTYAALTSYGDAEFWEAYRARLLRAPQLDLAPFFRWFEAPERRVVLVLRPSE